MVRDVFSQDDMLQLEGNAGIGHCRYPTAGTSSKYASQPMYNNYPCGLALAHNGNLTNSEELREHVRSMHRHLSTNSDSEGLLNVFAEELRDQLDLRSDGARTAKITSEMIFAATEKTMGLCRGGYACVMLIHDIGVLAFRDPYGIRPLVLCKRASRTIAGGIDYCFASESVAGDTLGFELVRDVKPGEAVLVIPMKAGEPRQDNGLISRQLIGDGNNLVPCLFEYVYFARPDSVMNGVSVYEARLKMGEKLAEKVQREYPDEQIDVVIPIPDTSRTSALSCAIRLGLPYREGFIKNRYIGRTFIMPEQATRKKNVRLKLNTVKTEFKDKNVLLVDDSIVRGTTSEELVKMAREAGASKVFFSSAAPEIRYPNVYGIDLPAATELIAHKRSAQQIADAIGCDWVLFNDLSDLEDSVREFNPALTAFETSTFTGKYVTADVDAKYLETLEKERNNASKIKAETRERNGSIGSGNSGESGLSNRTLGL